MSEWAIHTLGALVEPNRKITYGIVQPGPDISPDGIPLIRGKDYSSGKVSTEGLYHVLPEIDAPFQRSKVRGGDLLLSIAGYVGKAAIVPESLAGANLTQTTARLSIDESKAYNKFVFYILNSEDFDLEVKKYEKGSAQSGLNLRDVEKFKISLPDSLDQQQKIAHILTTVDNLIEKTQAIIDKYAAVKQGMMHDLFTRGIDLATGRLRPSYEQAPELYKETELGWVPKEWGVVPSVDVCERICVGIVIQPTQYYTSSGVPAFRSANIREEGIDPVNFVYISRESNATLLKSQVRTGDVLSVRTGYPGTSAIVPEEFDGANCVDIIISTPNIRVKSEYLCEWINSDFGKGQVIKKQGGMAQQHFNVGDMKELLVALPPENEQVCIILSFKSLKDIIQNEKNMLDKLILQKKGLMQDLLTGRVRVDLGAGNGA